jgi:hypothetical protein
VGWQLAPGTGFCEVDGELVFLDLARDKYFSLRRADRAAFNRLRVGEPNDSDSMMRLVQTHLIARCETETRIEPTEIVVPTSDLSVIDEQRPLLGMIFAAARALRWARRAMAPELISTTVEHLAQSKRRIGVAGTEDAVVATAAAYAACRWLNPIPPRCLIDALALDRILLARGLVVRLVFGVRLSPFNAHCWLQTQETILTGSAAEARNFTPVYVVG